MASYARTARPEDVLLLYDDTLFGGAREGLCVTPDELFFQNARGFRVRIAFAKVTIVDVEKEKILVVNDKRFFFTHEAHLPPLLEVVNEMVTLNRREDEG